MPSFGAAKYVEMTLMNLKLAKKNLDLAVDTHTTPHSQHCVGLKELRSELADFIHKVEGV